ALRFKLARQRLGMTGERKSLRKDLFRKPVLPGGQLALF
ncbi:MAG: radical SAM protein, partial [Hyphomicrobium sp.]